jgi:hypothetical protein
MRGTDVHQEGLFSYLSPESRIPKEHPLRPVREMVNTLLLYLQQEGDAEIGQACRVCQIQTGNRESPPARRLGKHGTCRSGRESLTTLKVGGEPPARPPTTGAFLCFAQR